MKMPRDDLDERILGEILARFHREIKLLTDLNHRNIVRFYDAMEIDGRLLLIMEYVRGKNAKEWTDECRARGQYLPINQTVQLGCQMLDALHATHKIPVHHRDMKPNNLIIAERNREKHNVVKVLDFGIAWINDGIVRTRSNDRTGTPHFMSPEQAARGLAAADEKADQYSAAATLYYLLTGDYTHDFPNPEDYIAVRHIIETTAPMPIRQRRPEIGFFRQMRSFCS